jgi:hypothetical protein
MRFERTDPTSALEQESAVHTRFILRKEANVVFSAEIGHKLQEVTVSALASCVRRKDDIANLSFPKARRAFVELVNSSDRCGGRFRCTDASGAESDVLGASKRRRTVP